MTDIAQFRLQTKDLTKKNIDILKDICLANNLTMKLKGTQYIISGESGNAFELARKKIQEVATGFRQTNRVLKSKKSPSAKQSPSSTSTPTSKPVPTPLTKPISSSTISQTFKTGTILEVAGSMTNPQIGEEFVQALKENGIIVQHIQDNLYHLPQNKVNAFKTLQTNGGLKHFILFETPTPFTVSSNLIRSDLNGFKTHIISDLEGNRLSMNKIKEVSVSEMFEIEEKQSAKIGESRQKAFKEAYNEEHNSDPLNEPEDKKAKKSENPIDEWETKRTARRNGEQPTILNKQRLQYTPLHQEQMTGTFFKNYTPSSAQKVPTPTATPILPPDTNATVIKSGKIVDVAEAVTNPQIGKEFVHALKESGIAVQQLENGLYRIPKNQVNTYNKLLESGKLSRFTLFETSTPMTLSINTANEYKLFAITGADDSVSFYRMKEISWEEAQAIEASQSEKTEAKRQKAFKEAYNEERSRDPLNKAEDNKAKKSENPLDEWEAKRAAHRNGEQPPILNKQRLQYAPQLNEPIIGAFYKQPTNFSHKEMPRTSIEGKIIKSEKILEVAGSITNPQIGEEFVQVLKENGIAVQRIENGLYRIPKNQVNTYNNLLINGVLKKFAIFETSAPLIFNGLQSKIDGHKIYLMEDINGKNSFIRVMKPISPNQAIPDIQIPILSTNEDLFKQLEENRARRATQGHSHVNQKRKPYSTKQILHNASQYGESIIKEGAIYDSVAPQPYQQKPLVNETAKAAGKVTKVAGKATKTAAKATKAIINGIDSTFGRNVWALVAMAAVCPNTTAEFLDDIAHLRGLKIARDIKDGAVQIVFHPIDTATAIGTAIADTAVHHYKGTDGVLDALGRTAMIPVHAWQNVGDVEGSFIGSGTDAPKACINWIMDACDVNTEIIQEGTTIDDFKQHPFEFFQKCFSLTTRDKTTGLRSDDDFNSLIFRGDIDAFNAYLKTGVDVNTPVIGDYDRGSHPYPTAFTLAVAEGQFDMANILLNKIKTNINGKNKITGDTALINAIKSIALDENSAAYFTGKPNMSKATPKAKERFIKANAFILQMIQDNRLEIEATNTFGETAFLTAAGCGNIAAMTALATKGANIHHTNTWGQNALHVACCNQLMTKELLSRGLDANAKDKDGNTPLMTALEKNAERGGKNDIVVCLLLGEMNTDGLDILRNSPKHSRLLDEWISRYPQVKEIIMKVKDHPLNKDKKFIEKQGQNRLTNTLSNAQIIHEKPVTTMENEQEEPNVQPNLSTVCSTGR
ncbi:MAG: ankyrin repeat domain-containing protein [Alphaproteobacteria bacterium]|nr:ankyrin repeat domain-containing protein [Alphaproteobacteria bacterium]